jgi:hypothetical protein
LAGRGADLRTRARTQMRCKFVPLCVRVRLLGAGRALDA